MKKSLTILLILSLLPLISGIETTLKNEFDQGETLTAKISGNFVKPILPQNVFLKRGHVRTAFEPGVTKINEEYFIYGSLLNKNPGNYTLVIENSEYYSGANIIDEDIEIQFTISNSTADFYVLPGFIITNSTFEIKIQNIKPSSLSVEISTTSTSSTYSDETPKENKNESFFSFFTSDAPEEKIISEKSEDSIYLKSGEIKNLDFIAKGFREPTLKYLVFTSSNTRYEIPIQINQEDNNPIKKEIDLNFEKSDINISLALKSETTQIIYLKNTGKQDLENIELLFSEELEDFIDLPTEEIESLDSNSSIKLKLTINSEKKEGTYYGQLKAILKDNESIEDAIAITLNFIKDYVPLNETNSTEDNQTSSSSSSSSTSSSTSSSSSSGSGDNSKLTGWIILAIVGVLLAWFFLKKYPSTKKKFDLMAAARKKK